MVGLLTFYWADDYGALLQAFALKHYLEETTKEQVEIIPYAPVKLTGRYWFFPFVAHIVNKKVKYYFSYSRFNRNFHFLPIVLKRRQNMRNFRHKYLTSKFPVRNISHLSVKKYSLIFIGSDQVWNPEITVGLDDAYIGKINKKNNCQLIAYAASFGNNKIPDEYITKFTSAIQHNFSLISVREKNAVPFVEHILNDHITDVLDPTLLLSQEEWLKIGGEISQHDYILFLCTEYNELLLNYVYALSKRKHKKIIQLSLPASKNKPAQIELHAEAGPTEFIGYFQNASYVVTNSFHGTVFSILLEKQFLIFKHSNKNARMESLLEKLDLTSRLITNPENETFLDIDKKINWDNVKKHLQEEKKISEKFIYDALQLTDY